MFIPPAPVAMGFYMLVESVRGMPAINVEATCRESEKAIASATGDVAGAGLDNCLRQERAARDQLNKDWAGFAAADKARCIQPASYMPSYIEWLTCLENAKAARNLPPPAAR
jgi:hypothetical protein